MTSLSHIVGPQGSGKSTLAQMIVRGCGCTACVVDAEDAMRLSNAQIRARHADIDLVCVEAVDVQPRHGDLQPGDKVLLLTAPAKTKPHRSPVTWIGLDVCSTNGEASSAG